MLKFHTCKSQIMDCSLVWIYFIYILCEEIHIHIYTHTYTIIYICTHHYIYIYNQTHFIECIWVYIWPLINTDLNWTSPHFFKINIFLASSLGCGTCRYGGFEAWESLDFGILRGDPGTSSLWIPKDDYVTWSERNWLYYYLLLVSLNAHIFIIGCDGLTAHILNFLKIIAK